MSSITSFDTEEKEGKRAILSRKTDVLLGRKELVSREILQIHDADRKGC
jgi:hypothetical protein